jgi:Protein of unknown function (DUF3134)
MIHRKSRINQRAGNSIELGWVKIRRTSLMNNPSLQSMPRAQKAGVYPPNMEGSILGWLEDSGRFMEQEVVIDPKLLEDEDELTVALIGNDDYGDDDDDFSNDDED